MSKAEEIKTQLKQSLIVKFGTQLKPNGDVVYGCIEKGGTEIYLTVEQAKSLANEINRKLR